MAHHVARDCLGILHMRRQYWKMFSLNTGKEFASLQVYGIPCKKLHTCVSQPILWQELEIIRGLSTFV